MSIVQVEHPVIDESLFESQNRQLQRSEVDAVEFHCLLGQCQTYKINTFLADDFRNKKLVEFVIY